MTVQSNKFDLNLKNGAINTLRTLGPKVEKKYLRQALRKGAVIVRKAAQTKAKTFDDPKTPQMVWKQIAIFANAGLGRKNGGLALQIGVKGGAKKYKNSKNNRRQKRVGQTYMGPGAVYYWRFLEFGTSKMKAQPFMRPALANNVDAVTRAITDSINDGIDKIVADKGQR